MSGEYGDIRSHHGLYVVDESLTYTFTFLESLRNLRFNRGPLLTYLTTSIP